MLSKKVVKDIQSLGLKKYRDESGLFVAEGPKTVEELLELVPGQIEAIYATDEWNKGKLHPNFEVISSAELAKISRFETPNKVVAVVRKFKSEKPKGSSFTIYLDAVQDPGNFGTIIRIADWFGLTQVVCSPGCADLYNSKVVQSTMGSIARVNVYYDDEETWLNDKTQTIYAASLEGKSLHAFSKTDKGILIIGNESKGIRKAFMDLATAPITIPKRGGAESLNAAVATGIILSHLLA